MSVTTSKQKWAARDMAYVAIFAVTIAICSWISIPTTVPFTLQTFAVFLAVGVLGGRRGTFAVLVPTPNGAGPWHFAVKSVLVLYAIPQDDAVLFVLIVHTLQTFLVVLLGLYALAALTCTRKRA